MSWLAGINFSSVDQMSYLEAFIEENKSAILSKIPSAFAEIVGRASSKELLRTLRVLESKRIYINDKSYKELQEILGYKLPEMNKVIFANNYSDFIEIPSRSGFLIILRSIEMDNMLNKNMSTLDICRKLGISRRTVRNNKCIG